MLHIESIITQPWGLNVTPTGLGTPRCQQKTVKRSTDEVEY